LSIFAELKEEQTVALYSERHGMRKPLERASTISVAMYAMLFDCCEKYFGNLAWKFPAECPDGQGCYGLDYQKFSTYLEFDIPGLYRNASGQIDKPSGKYYGGVDDYDQYALLDLIEFVGQNCMDFSNGSFHSFFGHYHIRLLETRNVIVSFRNEINDVFKKTGLLYMMTENMIIERVIENDIITPDVAIAIGSVKETGLKDLLDEAIVLFRQPNPAMRNDAVEKIWDVLERLKTYYSTLDKKASVTKIVSDMSSGQSAFEQLFDTEFSALTKVGNDYRIRHHETNKIDINDIRHYDYFFNRCLSLIAVAIQYLT
jgi:hypothetical protein